MTSTAKKFMLFFVISSLFVCSVYFAWAWSQGVAENKSLQTQVTSMIEQSKNTEAAILALRSKDEQSVKAREIESKNDRNLNERYLKAQEKADRLERELESLKVSSAESDKKAQDAQEKASRAERELKDKETIIASQWRRIERLETRSKSLDQENQFMQSEAKRLRQEEMGEGLKQAQEFKQEASQQLKKVSQEASQMRSQYEKTLQQKEETIAKLTRELQAAQESEKRLREALKKAEGQMVKPQDQFRKLATKVETLQQEAATAHYNLGVMHMRSGRYKDAVSEFGYSLQANPSDASAHYNLAVIYDAYLADSKRAISHYEQYLRLQPKADDFQKVQFRVLKIRTQKDNGIGEDIRSLL